MVLKKRCLEAVLLRPHMEGNNRPAVLYLSLECIMPSETFVEKLCGHIVHRYNPITQLGTDFQP